MKARPAVIAAFILVAVALGLPDSVLVQDQAAPKAIVLSWDGTVPSFIHELLRQGKMPHLAKLIAGGAFADAVIPAFPSKTAPGHASLWTGAPPKIHGISGNNLPRAPRGEHTILESASGFESTSLRAEPLWMSAARAGRRAVVVQATQGWPFETYTKNGPFGPGQSDRLVLFEGYGGTVGRDVVITARETAPRPAQSWSNLPASKAAPLEISLTIEGGKLFGLFTDDPQDLTSGYDTLIVTRIRDAAKAEARLKAGPVKPGQIDRWSAPIEIDAGNRLGTRARLRLFELKPDGSDFLLYITRPARELSSRPALLPELRRNAGVFIGNGASRLYRQGAFGPTIPQGGDGTAERRYLETVLVNQRHVMDATRWALQNLTWDLLFTYSTYPDEAEHLWRGYLDPALPGFRREIADKLRPFLEEVYRSCDELLGALLANGPANTVVALVSDHGMGGTDKVVRINTALQRGGLLATDQQGRVDLARTKAYYPAANNAYILINTKDRKDGMVAIESRNEVVNQIRDLLGGIHDGGRQVVTGIFDAQSEGESLGIGAESGGDVYLDLLPGYDFDARANSGNLIAPREPYGAHGFFPLRDSMRTLMVLNGPGVAAGKRLQQVRLIDFAPTVAKLLKIPAPWNATGRVLEEALSR